jgi:hypothetical protein
MATHGRVQDQQKILLVKKVIVYLMKADQEGEKEESARGNAQILACGFPERFYGVDDMPFHGISRDAKFARDLLIGSALFFAFTVNIPGPGGQRVQYPLDKTRVIPGQDLVIEPGLGSVFQDLPQNGLGPGSGSQGVDRMIACDREQPSAKVLDIPQLIPCFPDLYENFLKQVFGKLRGFDEAENVGINSGMMLLVNASESILVSCGNIRQELRLVIFIISSQVHLAKRIAFKENHLHFTKFLHSLFKNN